MTKSQVRVVNVGEYQLQIDLSTQVLGLELARDRDFGHVAKSVEAPLHRSVATLGSDLISASVLAQKAKSFDDGLYAAVEFAAQEGAGRMSGKKRLLASLARTLKGGEAGKPGDVILAATALGAAKPKMSEEVASRVRARIDAFLNDDVRSKPIGFYTWSDSLGEIFRQDRMLQVEMKDADGIGHLVRMLGEHESIRSAYEQYLRLAFRLTNPPAKSSLVPLVRRTDGGKSDAPEMGVHFLPPSLAHETELAKRLYGNEPIPAGFDLVTEMVRRTQEGELDLTPRPDSGWYDYVTWSLEPLLVPDRMPESKRLYLGERYRNELVELFKGILALARETHVKQFEVPVVGRGLSEPTIEVHPELSVEPLPSHYSRRAEGYRFARQVLTEAFGEAALAKLRRLTPQGAVAMALDEEINAMIDLFDGASSHVASQLGMDEAANPGDTRKKAAFTLWARDWKDDSDLARDARMMVPVFSDILRKKTKVWAFLGWTEKPVFVWFRKVPDYVVTDAHGTRLPEGQGPRVTFESYRTTLVYPVTAEVYVDRILDREEFQDHCDRYETKAKILAALA